MASMAIFTVASTTVGAWMAVAEQLLVSLPPLHTELFNSCSLLFNTCRSAVWASCTVSTAAGSS